jgi:hypothetical protein
MNLGRSLQMRFRPVEAAHLPFVAGKVEVDRAVIWMQALCARQNRVGGVN